MIEGFSYSDSFEAFLLLDESERDNRLLSTSTTDLPSKQQTFPSSDDNNKKDVTIVDNLARRTLRVVCNLKEARWDKVSPSLSLLISPYLSLSLSFYLGGNIRSQEHHLHRAARRSHLCHRTRRIWQSLSFSPPPSLALYPLVSRLELTAPDTHRRDRLLRRQSPHAWLVLLCSTRAMFVSTSLFTSASTSSVQGSSRRPSRATFCSARTTTIDCSSEW